MDILLVSRLLEEQSGVVARRQVRSAGFNDDYIARRVRRREWATIHPGIYVNHTGPLTWRQRAWAAVLFYWPAALSHTSALQIVSGTPLVDEPDFGHDQVIHVAIEHPRKAVRVDGVRLHRMVNLDGRVRWNTSPPRMRLEEATLDVCADAPSRAAALAIAADVCQQRRTTPSRLLDALEHRKRMRFGRWMRTALSDVALGAMSLLERGYLQRVERAHGLPRARRQLGSRTEDGIVYRDVEYEDFGLVVELDGRIGHELSRDRWKDMDRDLLAAVTQRQTVRLGWVHIEDRPCVTASRVGRLLQQRGWRGATVPCGPECALMRPRTEQPGRSSARGARDRPR